MQNFDTKMQIFYAFVNIYANIFGNIQKLFRLTFPVVNDGLPALQTVRFAGLANCGGVRRGNGEAMT